MSNCPSLRIVQGETVELNGVPIDTLLGYKITEIDEFSGKITVELRLDVHSLVIRGGRLDITIKPRASKAAEKR